MPIDSTFEARTIYQALIQSYESGERYLGDQIHSLRKALNISVEKFAEKTEISQASYARYRSSERPVSDSFIDNLARLVTPETSILAPSRQNIVVHDNCIPILVLEDLLERHAASKTVWAFKHSIPFRAGSENKTRSLMSDLLADEAYPTHLNFVFCAPSESSEPISAVKYPAYHSFAAFKKHLVESDAPGAERLRGWKVIDDSTNPMRNFALPFLHTGTVIDFYDSKRTERSSLLRGRSFDIFSEVQSSTYSVTAPWQLNGTPETVWIEYSQKAKGALFASLKNILSSASDHFEEFLANPKDVKKYQPPDDLHLLY